MKKVLSLVLALAMALGICTTAFASDNKVKTLTFGSRYLYTLDNKVMTQFTGDTLEPGETYYYYLAKGDATGEISPITKLSELDSYRMSYTADEGKNMIKSIKFSIENVNAMNDAGNLGFTAGKNAFIAFELKDNFILEAEDLSFSLTISGKNDAKFFGYADSGIERPDITGDRDALSYNYTAGYPTDEYVSNGYYTIEGGMVLGFDDDADDVILCFDEDVEVAGNMKGQKNVFVRMATSNDSIEDKYPEATLRFFEGDKDTFRRDVKVTIPYESSDAEKAPYLYEVASNGALSTVKGAKYDEELGAFVFETKTLGNYLINDTALKSVVDNNTNNGTAPNPGNGSEQNPGTGASDFAGVAVALAVVAAAGIAVAKRK